MECRVQGSGLRVVVVVVVVAVVEEEEVVVVVVVEVVVVVVVVCSSSSSSGGGSSSSSGSGSSSSRSRIESSVQVVIVFLVRAIGGLHAFAIRSLGVRELAKFKVDSTDAVYRVWG